MLRSLHLALHNVHPPKGSNTGNIGHHNSEIRKLVRPPWTVIKQSMIKHGACSKWVHYEKQRYIIKQKIAEGK